jgi:hypothetical protein
MKDSNVKWTISLSDGSTYYEGKGDFKEKEGILSPYQRLLKHIEKKGLEITSLSLYTDDGRRWNLPSSGKNPRFRAFDLSEKPKEYKFFKKIGVDVLTGKEEKEDRFAVIEAVYKDYKIQLWVSEEYPYASWVLVI